MIQTRIVPAFAVALACLPVISLAASAQSMSTADRKELRQACGAEIKELCAGVTPGGGKIIECVKSKKDQLSPTCTATLERTQAARRN